MSGLKRLLQEAAENERPASRITFFFWRECEGRLDWEAHSDAFNASYGFKETGVERCLPLWRVPKRKGSGASECPGPVQPQTLLGGLKVNAKARLKDAKMLGQRITENRRGRPALSSAEKRMCIVTVRLTESEYEFLQEETRIYGLSLSELIRSKLFNREVWL